MGDDLGDLARLDAVVEREVRWSRHLDRLVARDERRERDDAAVPRREARAFPDVAEQAACAYFSSAGATTRISLTESICGEASDLVWLACEHAEASSESDMSVTASRL